MKVITKESIPFIFQKYYDDLLKLSNGLKNKFLYVQTQSMSNKEINNYLIYFDQLAKKAINNNKFYTEEEEYLDKINIFLDGKKFFIGKIHGFSLVLTVSNEIFIINPITNIHYWTYEQHFYINGSPVASGDKKIDSIIDKMDYNGLSNSLLIFLNKIGNIKQIECDHTDINFNQLSNIFSNK